MDPMGPMQVEDIGRRRYAYVMVDDYSGFTWINIIQEQYDTFEVFKDLSLQSLREFENARLSEFCISERIKLEVTSLIAVMDRTIQESARAMLHAKNSPYHFKAEAICTTWYTHNHVTLRKGTASTLYKLWKGRNIVVKYFHVFGSKCYILADKGQRGKMASKNDEGLFLEYSTTSRAYRVFNSRTKTVMVSVNIVIDNSSMLKVSDVATDVAMPHRSKSPTNKDTEIDSDATKHVSATTNKGPSIRIQKNHLTDLIIRDPVGGATTRRTSDATTSSCLVSKQVKETMTDKFWEETMQKELNQFKRSKRITHLLVDRGYRKGDSKKTLVVAERKSQLMIALMNVDDITFGRMSNRMVQHFVKQMQSEFEMGLVGELTYLQDEKAVGLDQRICAKYQAEPKMSHLTQFKRVLKYVNGTCNCGTLYSHAEGSTLIGYCVAVWEGSADGRKSTSGGCFFLDKNLLSWFSKKQNCVSLSISESEYIAAGSSCSQLVLMKEMLKEYNVEQEVITLFCDNLSAINISKDSSQHSRTKHIVIRHHFIRDSVEENVLALEQVDTEEQLADIFTKALDAVQFENLRGKLGICLHEEA
ncbi:putative gag-pol polyprotein [Trifolium medium]|uniref:Putative gag-pol polyprotein n=1 Tax=Trifolium medium TaxID=97028 RepID=A0A392LXC3_9FABA|nr:putative gag-pol polyprotein [Trifolium medium]